MEEPFVTFTRWLEDHRDEIEQPSVLARAQASEVRVIMRWPNTGSRKERLQTLPQALGSGRPPSLFPRN